MFTVDINLGEISIFDIIYWKKLEKIGWITYKKSSGFVISIGYRECERKSLRT